MVNKLCMRFCRSGDVNQNSKHDLLKSRDTSKMKTKGLGIETVWVVLLCQCSTFLSSWGTSTCQICMVHILFWSWSGTKSISLIATARSHFFQICSCPAQYQFCFSLPCWKTHMHKPGAMKWAKTITYHSVSFRISTVRTMWNNARIGGLV